MRTTRSEVFWILAGLMLVTLTAGCSSPLSESSMREGTVSGIVKVRGKPISGGELHFNASNPRRKVETRAAAVDQDGRYTVRAYIGLNIVNLTPPRAASTAQHKDFFGVGYEEKPVQVDTGDNRVDLDFLAP